MKTKLTLLALALGASTCLLSAQDSAPPSDNQQPAQQGGGPGGPGGTGAKRGPGGQGGFHLLPPRALEQLKLTDDQKQQLAALEAETKAKVEKILTSEQLDQLKNLRPPMGQGGPNGPMMRGGPGGPGGPQMRGSPMGPGQGRGGDHPNFPPGPPPGNGDGNFPPPGPPPGEN